MIVGRRSFSFGSQYLSENVTSDSDTWPSESHALIISISSCGDEIVFYVSFETPKFGAKNRNQNTGTLNADSAEREPLSPARRVHLCIAARQSRGWPRRACLSHLPQNAPSYSHSA